MLSIVAREQTAANTRGPLAGPAGESPEKNCKVANGAMQIRDVVVLSRPA
jgi:hypothetical protein